MKELLQKVLYRADVTWASIHIRQRNHDKMLYKKIICSDGDLPYPYRNKEINHFLKVAVLNACFCTVAITAHLSSRSAKNGSCVCMNALPLLLFSLSWAMNGLFTLLSSKNTYKKLGDTVYITIWQPSYNSVRSGQARKISDTVATCWTVLLVCGTAPLALAFLTHCT